MSNQPNDGGSDYFSIKAMSNSGLKLFKRSRAEYFLKYVKGEDFDEPSDALRFGSAVHCLALEPHKFGDWVMAVPPLNKSTGKPLKSGQAFDEWKKNYEPPEGKQWITEDEFHEAARIVRGLWNHPMIFTLLDDPDRLVEHEILHNVKADSGLWNFSLDLKCKMDLVIPSQRLIVDIKTAQSELPGDFRHEVLSRKYHWQSWIYRSLAKIEFGEDFRFLFAVVNKSSAKASLIELPEWMDKLAEEQVLDTLQAYCDWVESKSDPGDWRTGVCVCD